MADWVTVDPSTGQLYRVTIAAGGGGFDITAIGAATTPGSTTTVQSVVDYCSCHAELMPLANVGGYTQEPALSLANDVLQEILSPPFAWKFNRVTANVLTTVRGKQDARFAGAAAFVLNGKG